MVFSTRRHGDCGANILSTNVPVFWMKKRGGGKQIHPQNPLSKFTGLWCQHSVNKCACFDGGKKKHEYPRFHIYLLLRISLSLSPSLFCTHTHIHFLCLTLPIQSPARKEKRISSKSPFIILGIVAPQWVWNVSHIKWLYCENLSNGSKVSNASNVVPTEHSWYSTSVLWRILCHNTEAPQSSVWGGFE